MKPLPPPNVPGTTEAERMDYAVRALLNTPKAAYDAQEARLKKHRERKKKLDAFNRPFVKQRDPSKAANALMTKSPLPR